MPNLKMIAQTQEEKDIYYMREALKEAQYAFTKNEVPIGAIIVCNDRIIARAHNMTEHLTDVTAHAEMQAFTSASSYIGGKYLKKCTLYVTIEPCPMCAAASAWTQIDRIVFGARDNKNGFLRFGIKMLHPKTTLSEGVMSQDAITLMQNFFKSKR